MKKFAWCLFDFANSSFTTVALTAFGGPFFVGAWVGDRKIALGPLTLGGSSLWGLTLGTSMLAATLLSPWLGHRADRLHHVHRYWAASVAGCVMPTALLAFLVTAKLAVSTAVFGWYMLAVCAAYALANLAYEVGYVFYNAFLPALEREDRLGRLSGYGWALGYLGGLGCLAVVRPWMPADYQSLSHSELNSAGAVFALVAVWYGVFALPALLVLRRVRTSQAQAREPTFTFSETAQHLIATIRQYPKIGWFLLTYFLYTDAVTTVIDFTGVFTHQVLGFSPKDNVSLFLILNVVAAPSTFAFGHLNDRLGCARTVRLLLVLWLVVVVGIVTTQTRTQFWVFATLAATILGSIQATSRTWMAQLAPPDRQGEFMGLMTLSGKASAVIGPMVYGLFADSLGHRSAMMAIGSFFLLAWVFSRRIAR